MHIVVTTLHVIRPAVVVQRYQLEFELGGTPEVAGLLSLDKSHTSIGTLGKDRSRGGDYRCCQAGGKLLARLIVLRIDAVNHLHTHYSPGRHDQRPRRRKLYSQSFRRSGRS